MINKKEIISEIDRLSGIREVVESYEEIAALRMRRIRGSVLRTRDFLFGITQIFHQVQSSYKNNVLRLMKQKKIKDPSKLSFLKKNGKTVYVLLSANTGLYGSIIKDTFNFFLNHLNKDSCDVVIIGRQGASMFHETKIDKKITYFDFPDNKIDIEALTGIVQHILDYEKIVVFHGQFQTVITQKPNISVISGESLKQKEGTKSNIKYLFEPSLEEIMAFFEKEIFAAIFEQTLNESQLAKFSSRMVILDQAVENIKNKLKIVEFYKRKQKHHSENRKQLNRLAGMSLWKSS